MVRWILSGLMLFLFVSPSPVDAQDGPTEQGSVVLGGSISWSSSGGELYENQSGDRYNSILVNPSALFFVVSGLAVGGELYVESESQGDADATTIGAGPAVAYFFGGPTSAVYPFLGTSVGYQKISTTGFDASGLSFTGTVGAAFMLSRSVALTAAGSYRAETLTVDQIDESAGGNVIRLQLGVDAFLF